MEKLVRNWDQMKDVENGENDGEMCESVVMLDREISKLC